MANIFVISDTHFGHANILSFDDEHGQPLRGFDSVEEMDEHMIWCWNRVVKPSDHIYHLGDVALKRQDVDRVLPRLNGHKRLVRGNHDIFQTKLYLRYFDEIYGVRVLDDMIMSHIPLDARSIKQRWHGNIHGHLHANHARSPWTPYLGDRYFNVSVECVDYTPMALEEIKRQFIKRKEASIVIAPDSGADPEPRRRLIEKSREDDFYF